MRHNAFLLGGGTRLAVHLGALKAVEESGRSVAAWAGVSGGGLVAAVLAAGYTHDEAVELMLDTDYRQFLDSGPWSWLRGWGLCSGRALEKWADAVFDGARFRDLNVPLSIVATDVETGEPFIFSAETTPEAKLATAVRCSIGIPGVFAVRRTLGRTLIDGVLAPVTPAELFPDPGLPSIAVRPLSDRPRRPRLPRRFGLGRYICRVTELFLASTSALRSRHLWTCDLSIPLGGDSPIDFCIPTQARLRLYQLGYTHCRSMLSERAESRADKMLSAFEPVAASDEAWAACDSLDEDFEYDDRNVEPPTARRYDFGGLALAADLP